MKRSMKAALLLLLWLFTAIPASSDDTCIFTVTADSVPPNVLVLLDNGADMEQIEWHKYFDINLQWDSQEYPDGTNGSACDPNRSGPDFGNFSKLNLHGDGGYYFCNKNGFTIDAGYLKPIGPDLKPGTDATRWIQLQKDGSLQTPLVMEIPYSLTYKSYYINGVEQPAYTNKTEIIATSIDVVKVQIGDSAVSQANSAEGVVRWVASATSPTVGHPTQDPDGDGWFYRKYSSGGNLIEMTYKQTIFYITVNSTSETQFNSNTNEKIQYGGNKGVIVTSRINTSSRKNLTLPATPSSKVDSNGIIDKAERFRYDSRYLNWLFRSYQYAGTGSDLPYRSRFYYAKMAVRDVAKLTGNKANFGLISFSGQTTSVAPSDVQPLKAVVDVVAQDPNNNVLNPNFINNINNLGTVTYSPLAMGLAYLAGGYASKSISQYISTFYCQKNFNIVITAGLSSQDQTVTSQGIPTALTDYDKDGDTANGGIGEGKVKVGEDAPMPIPVGPNGSTYLDDVAAYLHQSDIIGYLPGFQNLLTYVVGASPPPEQRAFLINTANNGNGKYNLYDPTDPEYKRFYFEATQPEDLKTALMNALNSILSRTASFTAPVVPVTRTTSGDLVYLAFFKPLNNNNFWEGNITKFGLGTGNAIVDKNGHSATWPNGAMRDDAVPFWATKWWGDPAKSNYMPHAGRRIYTYLGGSTDLTAGENSFSKTNAGLSEGLLGTPGKFNPNSPSTTPRDLLIDYIRGADSFDADRDLNINETRSIVHGDALHGEPVIIPYGSGADAATQRRFVFFSANDGMLHAVYDSNGREAWGFIPPDQLSRLKELTEGATHPYSVDSSPKTYLEDLNKDGFINPDYCEDGNCEKAILICGERMGGRSYFALDVSRPDTPVFLWRMTNEDDRLSGSLTVASSSVLGTFAIGETIKGMTSGAQAVLVSNLAGWKLAFNGRSGTFSLGEKIVGLTSNAAATIDRISYSAPPQDASSTLKIVSDMGQTWSEPAFTRVLSAACTQDPVSQAADYQTCLKANSVPVFIVGGGYSPTNSVGQFVLIAKILDGTVINKITDANMYSIPSAVTIIDADYNRLADKVYVGDIGGQLWRIGKFDLDMRGNPLSFPDVNENASAWTATRIFSAGCDDGICGDGKDNDNDFLVDEKRRFFYPPDVALEFGFDLVFLGSGDRDNACNLPTNNRIYAIKDDHVVSHLSEADLVDASLTTPNISTANGFYVPLTAGEKILAEGVVFYKVFYVTSFLPSSSDPCTPGGLAYLYSVGYKTGAAGADMNNDGNMDLKTQIGGGIGSKPVVILRDGEEAGLLISVGSTNPDDEAGSNTGAGVIQTKPGSPDFNFNLIWWRENQ